MSDVSVIGIGAMGSAIARALLAAGHSVSVWNRTRAKMVPVTGRGAIATKSPAAAIASSPLTIVCVDDYAVGGALLFTEEASRQLEGRTVLQLSTGTPAEARAAKARAETLGATYLDGCILAYPREIGDAALVFVAGNGDVFRRHEECLRALTSNLRYLGQFIGAAAALDLAVLSYYACAHMGLVHGALLCESENVEPDVLSSVIVESLPSDVAEIANLGQALANNRFSEPGASLGVYSGVLDRILSQARDAGICDEIPAFVDGILKRGVAAGLEDEEIVSVIKVLRRKH